MTPPHALLAFKPQFPVLQNGLLVTFWHCWRGSSSRQLIISPGCNHWNRGSTILVSPVGSPRAHPDPHTITHATGKPVPGWGPGQEEVGGAGSSCPPPLKLCP